MSDLKTTLESLAGEGNTSGARVVSLDAIGNAASVLRDAAVKSNLDKKLVRVHRWFVCRKRGGAI